MAAAVAACPDLQLHGALCEPTTPLLAQSVQPRWQHGSVARVDKLQWRQFSQVRFSSKLPLKPSIWLQVSELHILQSRLNIDITQLYLSSCCFSPATS